MQPLGVFNTRHLLSLLLLPNGFISNTMAYLISKVTNLVLSCFDYPAKQTTRRRATIQAVKHVQLQRVTSNFTTVSNNIVPAVATCFLLPNPDSVQRGATELCSAAVLR